MSATRRCSIATEGCAHDKLPPVRSASDRHPSSPERWSQVRNRFASHTCNSRFVLLSQVTYARPARRQLDRCLSKRAIGVGTESIAKAQKAIEQGLRELTPERGDAGSERPGRRVRELPRAGPEKIRTACKETRLVMVRPLGSTVLFSFPAFRYTRVAVGLRRRRSVGKEERVSHKPAAAAPAHVIVIRARALRSAMRLLLTTRTRAT